MPITRKTDYASRVVLDLSLRAPGEWTTTREIAERKLIPPQLIRQIITQLVKAGLVESRRGADGGVRLARPAAGISLLDVVKAVEGVFYLNVCVEEPLDCPLSGACPIHRSWVRLQATLDAELRQQTFDVLARQAGGPLPIPVESAQA